MWDGSHKGCIDIVADVDHNDRVDPGRAALIYDPSTVSWAVAEAVARPPAFVGRLALYLIAGSVFAVLLLGYFATVPINVSGHGMIRSVEKSRQIRAQVTGKIAGLSVANGAHVTRGQILIEMEELIRESERQGALAYLSKIDELLQLKDARGAVEPAATLAGTDQETNAASWLGVTGDGSTRWISWPSPSWYTRCQVAPTKTEGGVRRSPSS